MACLLNKMGMVKYANQFQFTLKNIVNLLQVYGIVTCCIMITYTLVVIFIIIITLHFFLRRLHKYHHQLKCWQYLIHYDDVIMTTMASQITSLTVVYSIVYSGVDQRKCQSSASLAFVRGIHRDRWIPHTKASNAENVSIWWRNHVWQWLITTLEMLERPALIKP